MKYTILLFALCMANSAFAQKEERSNIRKGNRLYNDSVFVDAEVNYRKALEINPQSTISKYNLGNALLMQDKQKEAMEAYVAASDVEKDKDRLAQIYHNMGVILQTQQDYAKAIEAYKQSLRNNPKDDETRYNLALAQKMLKDQQSDNQDQDQNKEQQEQEQQQNQDQQNQQQDQQDQQQKQEPPKENEMSKENAEQMLQSAMQDEKEVQDKVKKQMQVMQGRQLEKDW